MKAVLAALLLATPALAQTAPDEKPLCVDASHLYSYNARPISRHEVLARNAIGDRRSVRLRTSCLHMDRSARVALQSVFRCIGKGDMVAVVIPGEPPQTCAVTHVSPGEDYATAEYKD